MLHPHAASFLVFSLPPPRGGDLLLPPPPSCTQREEEGNGDLKEDAHIYHSGIDKPERKGGRPLIRQGNKHEGVNVCVDHTSRRHIEIEDCDERAPQRTKGGGSEKRPQGREGDPWLDKSASMKRPPHATTHK
jgi:hypothetical protein